MVEREFCKFDVGSSNLPSGSTKTMSLFKPGDLVTPNKLYHTLLSPFSNSENNLKINTILEILKVEIDYTNCVCYCHSSMFLPWHKLTNMYWCIDYVELL